MADALWALGLNRLTVVTGAKHEIGHAMLEDGVRAEIACEIFQGRLTVAASHPYRVKRRASRREPRQHRDIVNSMDRQAGIGRALHHLLRKSQHRWSTLKNRGHGGRDGTRPAL